MPVPTENLYVTTTTFTRYGQVALSVMGFAFTALLSTFSFYGKLKLNPRKIFAVLGSGLVAVVPSDFGNPFLFAYYMPPGADQIARYLDYWLELKQSEGFSSTQEKQWIEGIQPGLTIHRWCLIRDVFHWVKS